MRLALVACFVLAVPIPAHAEQSKAAAWLIEDAIDSACETTGTIDPTSVLETDLTGDGLDDLVLSFGSLSCAGQLGTNDFCGASGMCSVRVYVRHADGTLALKGDYLSQGGEFAIQESMPPGIMLSGHDGTPETLHWRGRGFE